MENVMEYSAKLLNAAQVAEILNVSKPLVYKLMQSGKLPCVHINSSRRVRWEDLEEFIINNLSNSVRVY